ncbi:hypothetical protein BCR44DRAFT_344037 [Catenaria anguillulae PL171]|uniref:Uncharacterized protein n=1 Tax=Catenaria anguillulae PL171 TaxID=765915 RepID=A0A1Y2HSB7_9FUNG|nr:hypothetical protein BCR44DRAFT_344037 [Catenaria anguillulae PL171]
MPGPAQGRALPTHYYKSILPDKLPDDVLKRGAVGFGESTSTPFACLPAPYRKTYHTTSYFDSSPLSSARFVKYLFSRKGPFSPQANKATISNTTASEGASGSGSGVLLGELKLFHEQAHNIHAQGLRPFTYLQAGVGDLIQFVAFLARTGNIELFTLALMATTSISWRTRPRNTAAIGPITMEGNFANRYGSGGYTFHDPIQHSIAVAAQRPHHAGSGPLGPPPGFEHVIPATLAQRVPHAHAFTLCNLAKTVDSMELQAPIPIELWASTLVDNRTELRACIAGLIGQGATLTLFEMFFMVAAIEWSMPMLQSVSRRRSAMMHPSSRIPLFLPHISTSQPRLS